MNVADLVMEARQRPEALDEMRSGSYAGANISTGTVAQVEARLRDGDPAESHREDTEPMMSFRSPSELRATTPLEPEWVWRGYLTPGALTIFSGKPKAGSGPFHENARNGHTL